MRWPAVSSVLLPTLGPEDNQAVQTEARLERLAGIDEMRGKVTIGIGRTAPSVLMMLVERWRRNLSLKIPTVPDAADLR